MCLTKQILVAALLLLTIASATPVMAQYALSSAVVSSGASSMGGVQYQIRGSVGQAVINSTSGAAYADSQGFWYTVGHTGGLAAGDVGRALPGSFALAQNFPNPFNPSTELRFQVPAAARVTIKIFNISGQLVETLADRNFTAGEHALTWNGARYATGIYLVRMTAPGFTEIRRAVLLK
jgi:membrane-bound inhibitor of C-type lysozyme